MRCNPLTRNPYDPVPLTKKEKLAHQERLRSIANIKPFILAHQQRYPKMEVDDYIKLIYDYSFDNAIQTDNLKFPFSDEDITQFFDRLYLLKQLIKNQQLLLNKKTALQAIEQYIALGIHEIAHSDIYLQEYSNHDIEAKKH